MVVDLVRSRVNGATRCWNVKACRFVNLLEGGRWWLFVAVKMVGGKRKMMENA